MDQNYLPPNPNVAVLRRQVVFSGDRDATVQRITSGANWILWILGLSMVNTLMVMLHVDFMFNLGLTATIMVDLLFNNVIHTLDQTSRLVLQAIGVVIDCGIFAVFGLCWYLAVRKFMKAWLVVAMVLFVLDTFLCLMLGDMIPVIIHLLAVFFMWQSLAAYRDVKIIRA